MRPDAPIQELGLSVAVHGKALTIKRRVGTKVTVSARDPLFRQLFRKTIAGWAWFEVDDAVDRFRPRVPALIAEMVSAGIERAIENKQLQNLAHMMPSLGCRTGSY
jgi:hypothetical protein